MALWRTQSIASVPYPCDGVLSSQAGTGFGALYLQSPSQLCSSTPSGGKIRKDYKEQDPDKASEVLSRSEERLTLNPGGPA